MPVLTSVLPARMPPSAPAELAFGIRRGHSLAVVHGTHRPPVPIARRPSARPAFRLLRALLAMRCPGSGPSARSSGSRVGRSRLVLPRVSARQPEPTVGWRDCPRLRSLLAANQWIAETSAVVEPILRGRSPHSLPIESPARAWSEGEADFVDGEKTRSPRQNGGDATGTVAPRPDHSDRQDEEAARTYRPAGPGGFCGDRADGQVCECG